jgi:hypothetical protein
MTKPLLSYRCIDQLKAMAFDCGFSTEDVKLFGKLSKTATWEAMLKTYGILLHGVDRLNNTLDNTLDISRSTSRSDSNFSP